MKQYPKMLYRDGRVLTEQGRMVHHSQTRVVADAFAEEAAAAEGFLPACPAAPDPETLGEEGAPEGGADTVSRVPAGLDTADEPGNDPEPFNGADPETFDHDGDGAPGGAPKGGNRKKSA